MTSLFCLFSIFDLLWSFICCIEFEEKMKKQVIKYYILLLLAIIFAAPSIAAYLFYQHPSWLGTARVNKGVLLSPPVVLDALKGNTKWSIIFWNPGVCDNSCLEQLNTVARIRLALGRKLYQVDQWLILDDNAPLLSKKQQSLLKEMDFKVAHLSATETQTKNSLFSEAKVFLADPGNYLILSYSFQIRPEDVYKDLKLLLNTTKEQG